MRRWISDTFKCLDIMILRDGAKFGEEFRKWESKVDVSEDLAKQVKAMGRQFVFQFLMNVRHRLQPSTLLACHSCDGDYKSMFAL